MLYKHFPIPLANNMITRKGVEWSILFPQFGYLTARQRVACDVEGLSAGDDADTIADFVVGVSAHNALRRYDIFSAKIP